MAAFDQRALREHGVGERVAQGAHAGSGTQITVREQPERCRERGAA